MSITLCGTCRICNVDDNNNLQNIISFTQSSKEAIQFIKFINGHIDIPLEYNMAMFRTGILEKKVITYNKRFTELFEKSNTVIVEICSKRVFTIESYYLHHLSVDERYKGHNNSIPYDIKQKYKMYRQTDEEIENDIKELISLVGDKRLIIVSHYNSKLNGEYLQSRNELIQLLEMLCLKYNITFVNPTTIFKNYEQHIVMQDDLGHFTGFGSKIVSDYINNLVRNRSTHHL